MLEELQRHNYSEITTRKYLRVVSDFAKHFGKSPLRSTKMGLIYMTPEQVQMKPLSPVSDIFFAQRRLLRGTDRTPPFPPRQGGRDH